MSIWIVWLEVWSNEKAHEGDRTLIKQVYTKRRKQQVNKFIQVVNARYEEAGEENVKPGSKNEKPINK